MGEDDRECGCPIHRIRRVGRLWGWFVHAWVHPISALIVMGAAGIEVLEWARHAIGHAWHLVGHN